MKILNNENLFGIQRSPSRNIFYMLSIFSELWIKIHTYILRFASIIEVIKYYIIMHMIRYFKSICHENPIFMQWGHALKYPFAEYPFNFPNNYFPNFDVIEILGKFRVAQKVSIPVNVRKCAWHTENFEADK